MTIVKPSWALVQIESLMCRGCFKRACVARSHARSKGTISICVASVGHSNKENWTLPMLEIWIILLLVWSTPLGISMHQHSTSGIRRRRITITIRSWHSISTWRNWRCGLFSLVVCITDKVCDIRERNVIARSGIWTTNIRSLGFRDIREWVTLWRLVLWSLGCS